MPLSIASYSFSRQIAVLIYTISSSSLSFRGSGIGVALVEGCKLKGSELNCRFMKVGTDPENLEAQAFYRAIGFDRQNSYPPRFVLGLDE